MSKVLIVDDSRTNLSLLTRLTQLVDQDIDIATAQHAKQAFKWLESNIPDLIIADYNMPDINGIEFTRRCRTMPICNNVPIVMVTSARRRKVCLGALRAGATEFLNSPLDEAEFTSRVGNLLKLRQQQASSNLRTKHAEKNRKTYPLHAIPELHDSWRSLVQVIDHVPVMLSAFDRSGRCLFVNAMQATLLNKEPNQLIGKNIAEFAQSIQSHLKFNIDTRVFDTEDAVEEFEQEHVDFSGTKRVLLTTKSPVRDETGNVVAVLTTSLDITARKRAEENLLYVAEHDSLTELPNRHSLRNHIARCIARTNCQDSCFALLFIDLDRFKDINDALGHDLGDRLLSTIAGRLETCVEKPHFVARIGGDEFAIVLSDIRNPNQAAEQAKMICQALQDPIIVGSREIRISASIGIAAYPRDGTSLDHLLAKADRAMYRAKADGGNGYCSFSPKDHERACRNAFLETDLRHAISRDQLVLHYQPKVELSNHRIMGAEALIRWQRPGHGLVPPGDFLALAEESDLILQIGEWVLNQACQDAKSWQTGGHPGVSISVNISPIQFAKQNIPDLVSSALAQSHINAGDLVLELTEQSMMRDTPTLHADLQHLRSSGVHLSLDDFGTGYASLGYLQKYPINELKIDRSFVKNHTSNDDDHTIVKAIIGLGESLNLHIVAEGVETLSHATSLQTAGCTTAQGYFFSPPVPLQEFRELLDGEKRGQQLSREICA